MTIYSLVLGSWHRGKGRQIQPGQKIHSTVAFLPLGSRPKARLPLAMDEWSKKLGDLAKSKGETQLNYPEDWSDWVEMDVFDSVVF